MNSGERLGAYRVTAPLGDGVWAACDTRTGASVAIKVPAHPNLVPVMDVVPTGNGPALVMPRAECSLHDLVARRGRLDPGEVITVAIAIAAALDALHRRGVVHGDVHPGNVLLAGDGTPWLADLDAAVPIGSAAVAHTEGYSAPEVVARRAASPASDQWSLAASCTAALGTHTEPILAAVLARAAAPEPSSRYPDMNAFARAVAAAAAASPVRFPSSAQAARTPLPGAPPVTRRFGPRPTPPRPERRAPGSIARALAFLGLRPGL